MNGGTNIANEPRQGERGGPGPASDGARSFNHEHRQFSLCQANGSREPIGPRADDYGIIGEPVGHEEVLYIGVGSSKGIWTSADVRSLEEFRARAIAAGWESCRAAQAFCLLWAQSLL